MKKSRLRNDVASNYYNDTVTQKKYYLYFWYIYNSRESISVRVNNIIYYTVSSLIESATIVCF